MIRSKFFTIILLFCTLIVFSQPDYECYDPPVFEFDGLQPSSSILISDTITPFLRECLDILERKYYISSFVQPKIIDKNIFFIFSNKRGGSVIFNFNIDSGNLIWRRDISPYTTTDEHGYGYWEIEKTGSNVLTLYGAKSIDPNPFFTPHGGYLNRRSLNMATGEDLEENSSKSFFGVIQSSSRPIHKLPEYNTLMYLKCISTDTTYSKRCTPIYLSIDSLDLYSPDFAAPPFFLDERSTSERLNFSVVRGPSNKSENEFVYTFRGYLNGIMFTELVTIDKFGNLLSENDITEKLIPSSSNSMIWYHVDPIENGLRFYTKTEAESKYFHAGYVDVDFLGNIIRKKQNIIIDGKRASHIRSINIKHSNKILHCIRFIESNDIYFYKEDNLGVFSEVGKMENNYNREIFAFTPQYMVQTDDGDLFMNFNCVLDSLTNEGRFAYGGWDYICKINAADLNLPNSTNDIKTLSKIHLFPNPTSDNVEVNHEIPQAKLQITDQFGRLIKTIENIPKSYTLSTDDMPPGMYYLLIMDRQNLVKGVEKLVVIR